MGKSIFDDPSYFGSGILLNRVIQKYGIENFRKEILEEIEYLKDLNLREIFWIQELNTKYPNGYNLTDGGDGGDTISNHPNIEMIRKRSSEIFKAYWTKENRERQSKEMMGKNNPWHKDNVPEAIRKKNGRKQKESRIKSGSYKLKKLISPENEVFVGTYNEFEKKFGFPRTTLSCYFNKGKIKGRKDNPWNGWEI